MLEFVWQSAVLLTVELLAFAADCRQGGTARPFDAGDALLELIHRIVNKVGFDKAKGDRVIAAQRLADDADGRHE